jgi:hypothetical protein
MNDRLRNASLHRYWFPVREFEKVGVGVTAFSEQEAFELAAGAAARVGWKLVGTTIRDVDVRDLDQNHVIPNMGLVTIRGVWFPNFGLEA